LREGEVFPVAVIFDRLPELSEAMAEFIVLLCVPGFLGARGVLKDKICSNVDVSQEAKFVHLDQNNEIDQQTMKTKANMK